MSQFSSLPAHVPTWVLALFAYLVWIGVKRLGPSVRELRRIWIVPAAFILWGLSNMFPPGLPVQQAVAYWLASAAVGGALGFVTTQSFSVDRRNGLVLLDGSVVPLVRNLAIFGLHFALRAQMAMHPDLAVTLAAWDGGVSGLAAGFFAGWMLQFARSYASAPQANLSGLAQARR